MATLLNLIPPVSASQSPTALILPGDDELDLSFKDLRQLVLPFRSVLKDKLGVRTGDVVGMSLVNGLEFVVGFLAIGASRAIAAPLNPAYSVPEFQFYLSDTKPVLLLVPRLEGNKAAQTALNAAKKEKTRVAEFWFDQGGINVNVVHEGSFNLKSRGAQDPRDPSPSDIALVLHTSGTTGRPKSVPLSHHNLLTTTENIIKTYDLRPSDRGYLVMPLFHVHGLLAGLLAPLRAGSGVVIPERFSVGRFWQDFVETKCNWYTAVPTIHTILLNAPAPSPLPKIKFIRSCSAALPSVILHRLEAKFKAPVLEAYAMTEAAHQMTSNLPHSRVPGSVGLGVGVEISVRDDSGKEVPKGKTGEVCVRGENVTKGYWNNEKANKESFWEGRWFRTGDQGLLLPSGHLQLTGRLKELINRGGEKISPLEVDEALIAVDDVAEAVSFGMEDEKYGEVVWAAVVLKSGKKSPGEEQRIRKALVGKLAKFKIPDRIIITPQIPKTATGKVQRRVVKEALKGKASDKAKAKL